MLKKTIKLVVDETGLGDYHLPLIVAHTEFINIIQVITPFPVSDTVQVFYDVKASIERVEGQFLIPTSKRGGDVIADKRFADYNVFEVAINSKALAYISKYHANKIGVAVSIYEKETPPLANNYIGDFDVENPLPEEANNGDFYVAKDYNFTDKNIRWTYGDYAYYVNGWRKGKYTAKAKTSTLDVAIDPSIESDIQVDFGEDVEMLLSLAGRVSEAEKEISFLDVRVGDIENVEIPRIDDEILRVENVCKNNESITWDELVNLRDNNDLDIGRWYRIIDYETMTTQEDTQSAGHLFDVLVLAVEKNKLSEQALATHSVRDSGGYFANSKLEAWKLWYCLDNDTNRFDWADNVNGKGVIYRMIDEFNNDVPYDFKNILFYPETYTFDDSRADASIPSQQVYNNRIKSLVDENIQYLNNIIIKGTNSCSNIFGYYNHNITLGNDSANNTFGNDNHNITLGNDSANNTFGNDCSSLTIGGRLRNSKFSSNIIRGEIGKACFNIFISSNVWGFKIPNSSQNLRILEGTEGGIFQENYTLLNVAGSTAILFTPRTYYKDKNGKFILEYAENGEIKRYYKDIGHEENWTEIKYEDIIIEKLRLATDSLKGLMSATDKARLDMIWAVFDDGADTDFIDTIKEILDIFENYPEGVDIVNLIGGKIDKTSIVDNLTTDDNQKVLSAKMGKKLADDKVDKVDGYGLSKNDYGDTDKAKVDTIVTDGDGDKYLADDGTYKAVSGGGESVAATDVTFGDSDVDTELKRLEIAKADKTYVDSIVGESVETVIIDNGKFELDLELSRAFLIEVDSDCDIQIVNEKVGAISLFIDLQDHEKTITFLDTILWQDNEPPIMAENGLYVIGLNSLDGVNWFGYFAGKFGGA